jgi:hypothetical protein
VDTDVVHRCMSLAHLASAVQGFLLLRMIVESYCLTNLPNKRRNVANHRGDIVFLYKTIKQGLKNKTCIAACAFELSLFGF